MTRGNINYIYQNQGEVPRTLFIYHNGDQYPSGLRDGFNVMQFVDGDWSIESFNKWIYDNYEHAVPGEIVQPKVYYTDGFITDYSYVFDRDSKTIKVWEWDKLVFSGDVKKFTKWIAKQ